ncbi:MAG: AMP-binding protein [Mariprofundus sp.]|nr:AMP-binding protein [Mariprofundus sp.]
MCVSSKINDSAVTLHFPEKQPFALIAGRALYPSELFHHLSQTTAIMSESDGDILLLCKGRYEFSLALLAAWLLQKNTILPPNLHPATLNRIKDRHSITLELNDGFTHTFSPITLARKLPLYTCSFNLHQQAITLYTSGSTGEPKPVHKTVGNLFSETMALKHAIPWPNSPLTASVPPNHLYGLTFSILLPWVLGVPVVDECPLHGDEVATTMQQVNGQILITVPAHLGALLEQSSINPSILVISSAGALSPELATQWQQQYQQEIVEIYGSSETGIIAYRKQLHNPVWITFDSVQISCNDEGLLQVNSPFIHHHESLPFQSQDIVSLQNSSGFYLQGRADSIVKIAGKRISLTTVENALKQCLGVLDAAVVAVPVAGHIRDMALWAIIATGSDSQLTVRDLRQQLLSLLEGIKIPRRMILVEQLPHESSGKLRRQSLMKLFQKEGRA